MVREWPPDELKYLLSLPADQISSALEKASAVAPKAAINSSAVSAGIPLADGATTKLIPNGPRPQDRKVTASGSSLLLWEADQNPSVVPAVNIAEDQMVAAHKPQQALVTASLFGPVSTPSLIPPSGPSLRKPIPLFFRSNSVGPIFTAPTLQSGPNFVLPTQSVPSSVQHLQPAPFSSSTQTSGLGPKKSFLSVAQHTVPTEPFSYGSLSLSGSIPEAIPTIANIFGTLLQVYDATRNKTRLHYARFCVALNIESPPPDHIVVSCGNKCIELNAEFERFPKYCYIKNPILRPAKINKVNKSEKLLFEPTLQKSSPSTQNFSLSDPLTSSIPSTSPPPLVEAPTSDPTSILDPSSSSPPSFLDVGSGNEPDSLELGSRKPNSVLVESSSTDSEPDSPNHSLPLPKFEDDFTVAPNFWHNPNTALPSPSTPLSYTNSSGKKQRVRRSTRQKKKPNREGFIEIY
ncbi:telomere repeat binding factor 1 [Striga asiatica]|uniref:Telomere repeat binding factor 1 n=1 Tax=Striga asiatica TaxID=4170 RepID=A0A5A7QG83_STRAF|nr:telomere repeat binding factor 1 [Striga asiatica]